MKRRGRARLIVARQPNGQPKRTRDNGTPELQAIRSFLAGEGDKTLTTNPVAILRANNAISAEMYDAALKFAWLHARVIGKPSLSALEYERAKGRILSEPDEEGEARLQGAYRDTMACFPSRQTRDDIVNLVVYERMPGFMRPTIPAPSDLAHGERIVAGLFALARLYGYVRERAA